LKQLIALATIDAPHFAEGTRVRMELTIDATRHFVGAPVVRTPFYSPARKTDTPPQ
jgi:glycine cleavage system aminomethyltransferase T